MTKAIYWFRNDLRVEDQPSLIRACTRATRLAPVFIYANENNTVTKWGFKRVAAHREHALVSAVRALKSELLKRGSDLYEYEGDPCDILLALTRSWGIDTIFCEEISAPFEQEQVARLKRLGLSVVTTWHSSLIDPEQLPFQIEELPLVFTDFRQRIEQAKVCIKKPVPALDRLPPVPEDTLTLHKPTVAKHIDYQHDARTAIPRTHDSNFAGTQSALDHIEQYFERKLAHSYKKTRNQLIGIDYSTKFSIWLASGAISARSIFDKLSIFEGAHGANDGSYWIWFELLWRDYFRFLHLRFGSQLYQRAGLWRPVVPKYKLSEQTRVHESSKTQQQNKVSQPPRGGALIQNTEQIEKFEHWCQGTTGNAFVDAAMRELKITGYLSNRMRQVTASYLIYALGLDWRAGAAWFEAQLIDYDVYSNQGNWLYIAGLGTDPRGGRAMQTEKQARDYDPDNLYRNRWKTQ